MAPSVQIPQDVLESIINELHDDIDSLKACAVVSHSFLAPTRRRLFFFIRLDNPTTSRHICNLFTIRPEIALCVRELFLLTGSEHLHRKSWLSNDKYLPTILKMMANLQKFLLSQRTQPLSWDQFSTELSSALVDRLRSPMLTVVKIWQCSRLPLSIIANFIHVKRLTLILTSFHDDSDGGRTLPASTLRLPQLHALEILPAARNHQRQVVKLFPQMDNLQLLSIQACDSYTLSVAQEVIRSCATSLRSVIWYYMWMKEEAAPIVHLGMIDKLQFLFIVMDLAPGERGSQFNFDFASLIRCFHDSTVTKSLWELTIAVKISLYPTWDDAIRSFSSATGWIDLDSILGNAESVIESVRICVELPRFMVADQQLQDSMRLCLPRLHEHGVLFIETGSIDDLQDRAWFGNVDNH